ncbi:MAG TPA: hypothetical protein VHD56_02990 [Tepidisphaeraceae bacterium]|nr:hypothetical protein [Tepidisphaeraceae bacterium]
MRRQFYLAACVLCTFTSFSFTLAQAPADQVVTSMSSLTEISVSLSAKEKVWIQDWEKEEIAGKPASLQKIEALSALLQKSDMGIFQSVPLLRVIAFVDGREGIEPLVKVVLANAKKQLSEFAPPDPTPRAMIDALWPLHDLLWDKPWPGSSNCASNHFFLGQWCQLVSG